MPRHSAGIVLYRRKADRIEVFLVHPGGPFWRRRDIGAWSIPKGEFEPSEDALEAARREFREETGFTADGEFIPLKPQKQPGGKIVHAWAVEGDADPAQIRSNTFALEWPPRSGRIQEFPEVDRAGWFGLDEAREKILKGQAAFLDELEAQLKMS